MAVTPVAAQTILFFPLQALTHTMSTAPLLLRCLRAVQLQLFRWRQGRRQQQQQPPFPSTCSDWIERFGTSDWFQEMLGPGPVQGAVCKGSFSIRRKCTAANRFGRACSASRCIHTPGRSQGNHAKCPAANNTRQGVLLGCQRSALSPLPQLLQIHWQLDSLPPAHLVHWYSDDVEEAALAARDALLAPVHERRHRLAQSALAVALAEHFLRMGKRGERDTSSCDEQTRRSIAGHMRHTPLQARIVECRFAYLPTPLQTCPWSHTPCRDGAAT